eukprot:11205147-Lingulodinium_polyedra.AAC.1
MRGAPAGRGPRAARRPPPATSPRAPAPRRPRSRTTPTRTPEAGAEVRAHDIVAQVELREGRRAGHRHARSRPEAAIHAPEVPDEAGHDVARVLVGALDHREHGDPLPWRGAPAHHAGPRKPPQQGQRHALLAQRGVAVGADGVVALPVDVGRGEQQALRAQPKDLPRR